MSIRRDHRAEPDDDDRLAPRVDVISVNPIGGRDNASAGILSLRRELATLHQQAAAFERTLEEQRRLGSAAEGRVLSLEARLAEAESEATSLRSMRASSLVELDTLRAERDELTRAVETAMATTAQIGMLAADAARVRASDEEIERLGTEFAVARKDAEIARAHLEALRRERGLEHSAAHERMVAIEQALDESRAAAAQLTAELAAARGNERRLTGELEGARRNATEAEQRALASAMAYAALEQSLATLRDDIAQAFARVGTASAPTPPSSDEISSPPQVAASSAERADGAGTAILSSDGSGFGERQAAEDASQPASTDSESESPQVWISMTSDAIEGWDSPELDPTVEVGPDADPVDATDLIAVAADAAPGDAGSKPAPAYTPTEPDDDETGNSSPPTRRPASNAPAGDAGTMSKVREELLAQLATPEWMQDAATALRDHPEWLRGEPPATMLTALAKVDFDATGAVFELGRAWEREPLCRGLVDALRSERDPRAREHFAWLLKHFADASSWKVLAELAREPGPSQSRRWLVEALDRLGGGRVIGWPELGDAITTLSRDADPSVRDGIIGVLASLERSDAKRRLLLEILRTDDDEVVLASAVNALVSLLPVELDQELMNRLLGHPSACVQASVQDLVARVKPKA